MNSKHIIDLTVRLSQALDQNYDVVDMDAVLSVISTLEGTTITKEQLEATRLAKYINQLRRRTKNDNLAKRAKSLLKKWREMVGIQQQASVNEPSGLPTTATMISDNNLHFHQQAQLQNQEKQQPHQQQYYHRSQPTSPLMGGNHLDFGNLGSLKYHAPSDFLRSTMSNPASTTHTSLTRSANINVHNIINKRYQQVVGPNQEDVKGAALASASASVSTSANQPTSFANLLTNFALGKNTNVSNTTAGQLTSSPRVVARKLNMKPQDGNVLKPTETFIIDQSSNSNSEISSSTTKMLTTNVDNATIAPIVIDIQDSNSDSELIGTIKNAHVKTTPTSLKIDAASSSAMHFVASDHPPLKQKRLKREKKKRDRENPMVVIDDNSSNPQLYNTEERKLISINDEKSRTRYPISNISEILSLSNSSIGSIFPGDGATSRVIDEQKRPDLLFNNREISTCLTTSDLTFAGKFKQHSNESSNLLIAENSLNNSCRNEAINKSLQKSLSTALSNQKLQQILPSKFVPFGGSGCNSNESTSNSRTSQFDVVELYNQDDNRNKVAEEFIGNKKAIPQKLIGEYIHEAPTTSSASAPVPTFNADLNTVSNIPEKKIPKKRGRKKGSKGVDAVIAKDISLSSQILMTSLGSSGKKVKTTKELYTEMQNRKLGIKTATSSPSNTNWVTQQQLISRPESSCSEPSLQSPRTLDACSTNATMSTVATRSTPDKFLTNIPTDRGDSDSDTITSEPSRDSGAAARIQKRTIDVDNNGNLNLIVPAVESVESKKTLMLTVDAIEKQLHKILKHFPTVPTIREMELECTADVVPCTCAISEISPQALKNPQHEQIDRIATQQTTAASEIKNSKSALLLPTLDGDMQNIQDHKVVIGHTTKKPKKSIFDLDFDDDEDPLHTYIAESTIVKQCHLSKEEHASIYKKGPTLSPELKLGDKYLTTESKTLLQQENQENMEMNEQELDQTTNMVSIYHVKEDPNCIAKQRFELQTQKITKFHVNALHNCYIPNVNGNWDNADTSNGTILDNLNADLVNSDGYHVVPKYGSLINERIRKDLSDVTFTKNFVPKKATVEMDKLNRLPFLGVSRLMQKRKKQKIVTNCLKKQSLENLIERQVEEQCSNNFYGSSFLTTKNINNLMLNDIKVDITEPESVESVQYTPKECKDNKANKDQSLLVIADDCNFDNNLKQTNTEIHTYKEAEINEKENEEITSVAIAETCLIDNTTNSYLNIETPTQPSKLSDGHTSRRSSSCSNSSLKQNQQSINLKLRRRRLLQQEKHQNKILNTFNSKRRHKHKMNKIKHAGIIMDRKPCSIKRIRIAINGNVATQRQISPCSNNSSDDYDDDAMESEKSEINNGCDHDDDDVMSNNSTEIHHHSQIETDEKRFVNSTNESGERLILHDAETIYHDPEYADFEEYEDEDEEEDYSGDFHEVVTRDISVPSAGNNHIVLTIKKTPSKTNSPSNSLSAMSPGTSTSATSITNNSSNNNKKSIIDLTTSPSLGIKIAKQEDYAQIKESSIKPGIEHPSASPTEFIYHQRYANRSLNTNEIAMFKIVREKISQPIRKHRTRRKIKHLNQLKSYQDDINGIGPTTYKKLHQQLFFQHELYVGPDCCNKEKILNISSCSSSCIEESEFERESSCDSVALGGIRAKTTLAGNSRKKNLLRKTSTSSTSSNSSTITYGAVAATPSDFDEIRKFTSEVNDKELELKRLNTTINVNETIEIDKTVKKREQIIDSMDDELPSENNGMLLSFNNIFPLSLKDDIKAKTETSREVSDSIIAADSDYGCGNVYYDVRQQPHIHKVRPNLAEEEKEQLEQLKLPNENCDDYNNLYNNNNNINLIKIDSNRISLINNESCKNSCKHEYSNNKAQELFVIGEITTATSKSKLNSDCYDVDATKKIKQNKETKKQEDKIVPHKEYRTGLRAVDEDVDDEDGNNCARIQQFKEWHQTLQLRSYNDELLTVLPYVVLE